MYTKVVSAFRVFLLVLKGIVHLMVKKDEYCIVVNNVSARFGLLRSFGEVTRCVFRFGTEWRWTWRYNSPIMLHRPCFFPPCYGGAWTEDRSKRSAIAFLQRWPPSTIEGEV